MAKRIFGSLRKLRSGRWQARYTGPDGRTYPGPTTFSTKTDANGWLSTVHDRIVRESWLPPTEPKPDPISFRAFADSWMGTRQLAPTTRAHYERLLRDFIHPTFGKLPVGSITPGDVRAWHAGLGERTGPTARAHSYGLLRTILGTAVTDEVINANPCRVRGAGQTKRAKQIRPASLGELELIARSVPPKYQVMILLGAWCALRFGELAELRRSDVDLQSEVIRVRRGVTTANGKRFVGSPKTQAGQRDVSIPPHLVPVIKTHLRKHATMGRDGLIFPATRNSGHMPLASLHRVFKPAREAAGRPDLRFHDLRHTGAVLAASTGATLAELMARLGHSTPGAAMLYQHASQDRDRVIAAALSTLAAGDVTPIRPTG